MTNDDNNALTALHRIWRHEADWMICQGCKRPIIASRDGEELAHADGCKHASEHHPWSQLRAILGAAPKPAKPARNDYPAAFDEVWDAYPPRANANKRKALSAWSALVKEGAPLADMLAGVKRYAAHIVAERKEERYTLQPATFFGPDEYYKMPWSSQKGKSNGSIGKQDYSAGVGPDGSF